METDLVASGCQVLPRGIIIKGVMPPERQDRSGGILNVGFGHGERDSAAGVSRERSDMCWSTLLVEQVDSQNGCLLRSEEHTSELQSLMRISYAVFCLKKKTQADELTSAV